jgi:hypothetical protein
MSQYFRSIRVSCCPPCSRIDHIRLGTAHGSGISPSPASQHAAPRRRSSSGPADCCGLGGQRHSHGDVTEGLQDQEGAEAADEDPVGPCGGVFPPSVALSRPPYSQTAPCPTTVHESPPFGHEAKSSTSLSKQKRQNDSKCCAPPMCNTW